MARFDVYGHFVVEVRQGPGGWAAWRVGRDGKREPLVDVPFPPDLEEGDLARHLEDVFHEYGGPDTVLRRLDDGPAGDQ